ncbi:MAG: hypothetical protein ACFFE8_13315 [Candidatus Heimdallarchaeota archaeon]
MLYAKQSQVKNKSLFRADDYELRLLYETYLLHSPYICVGQIIATFPKEGSDLAEEITSVYQLERFAVRSLLGFQTVFEFGVGRRIGIFEYFYERCGCFNVDNSQKR